MIVPFLFTFDDYSKEKPTHMVAANKSLDFCYKNNFPFITQDKYLKDPSFYVKKNHSAFSSKNIKDFQYNILNKMQRKKIDIEVITPEEEKKILSQYKNINDACEKLLLEENILFEEIIESKINNIEKKYGDNIEAIIAWIYYPSLEKIAKKHKITVLNYDSSTIRPGKYREYLFNFSIGNKYNNKYLWNLFDEFKKNNDVFMLSKKELIALFIDDEHITFINETDKNPEYEIGYALGLKNDCYVRAYDGNTYDDILNKLEKFVPKKKISVRSHPAAQVDESKYNYSFDHSFESIEWITKCKSIVCQTSNIGYEAILFDRGLISTNTSIDSSFNNKSDLTYYNPIYYSQKEVDFLTFYYYVPIELCFDVDYIRYRLKEKSIIKVYEYNMNYILKKYNLDMNKLKKMDLKERFITILNTHNISDEEKNKIIKDAFEVNRYNELEREKDKLIISQEKEINSIINSKGWKLLERIRKMKPGK